MNEKPVALTAKAIKAREYRRRAAERVLREKALLESARSKLTHDEWDAVENYFADKYYS